MNLFYYFFFHLYILFYYHYYHVNFNSAIVYGNTIDLLQNSLL